MEKEITLTVSELQAIVNAHVATALAKSATDKLQAQLAPPPAADTVPVAE